MPPIDIMQELADDGALDERYLVPGLLRGLRILEGFDKEHQERTLADMAARAGLSRSTTYRLVYSLEAIGYLEKIGSGRVYRLGTKVLYLGHSLLAGRDFVGIASPLLDKLRDRTHCSVHLTVLEGRDVVYITRASGRTQLVSGITVGSRMAALETITGRLILANMPLGDVVALYQDHDFAAAPIEDVAGLGDLVSQLESDRQRRSLISWGKVDPAIASAAAPLFDGTGAARGAIIADCPIDTYSEEGFVEKVAEEVEHAAAEISRVLGHSGIWRPTTPTRA
jgi:DNA-binding IclR family transcriptional regulator